MRIGVRARRPARDPGSPLITPDAYPPAEQRSLGRRRGSLRGSYAVTSGSPNALTCRNGRAVLQHETAGGGRSPDRPQTPGTGQPAVSRTRADHAVRPFAASTGRGAPLPSKIKSSGVRRRRPTDSETSSPQLNRSAVTLGGNDDALGYHEEHYRQHQRARPSQQHRGDREQGDLEQQPGPKRKPSRCARRQPPPPDDGHHDR